MSELLSLTYDDLTRIKRGSDLCLPPEQVSRIRSEDVDSGWERIEDRPAIRSGELIQQVGRRKVSCPLCGFNPKNPSTLKEVWLRTRGRTTGIEILKSYNCRCMYYEIYWRMWDTIPARFQRASLENIKLPSLDRVKDPEKNAIVTKLINTLKEQESARERGLLITGDAGIGKTTIAIALMNYACQKWAWKVFESGDFSPIPSIWRITAERFFREYHEDSTRDHYFQEGGERIAIKEPTVTERGIYAAANHWNKYRPFLLLEEIDKVSNFSEFKLSKLHAVINAVYETKGQLIVTTNWTLSQLESVIGKPIFRRLTWGSDDDPAETKPFILDLCTSARPIGLGIYDHKTERKPVAASKLEEITQDLPVDAVDEAEVLIAPLKAATSKTQKIDRHTHAFDAAKPITLPRHK